MRAPTTAEPTARTTKPAPLPIRSPETGKDGAPFVPSPGTPTPAGPERSTASQGTTTNHQPKKRSSIRAIAEEIDAENKAKAAAREAPTPNTTNEQAGALQQCLDTFRRWLYIPDPGGLYVTLATIAINRAPGDPVWLFLVGAPGSGKTEVITSLTVLTDVHPASTLTEAALLSGTPKKDHAANASGGLLRKIGAFGFITLKDFGSILNMHYEARGRLIAALREIYDGSWTRHIGIDGGQTLSWTGRVALIAGVTPVIDSHHTVIGSMGERFIMYRLPETDGDRQITARLAHAGEEKPMRTDLGTAVVEVLSHLDDTILLAKPDEDALGRLKQLAKLAAHCRSTVERDNYTREITLVLPPEAPARLALVLLRLHNGLRAIGVPHDLTWELVQKCALDSMPQLRRDVMEHVMADSNTSQTTKTIAQAINYPTTTTRRTLEDLAAHKLLARSGDGSPGQPDLWKPTLLAINLWPIREPEALTLDDVNPDDPDWDLEAS